MTYSGLSVLSGISDMHVQSGLIFITKWPECTEWTELPECPEWPELPECPE